MTAYEAATAWAAKRKAARQKFEAAQTEISNKLLSVGDAQSQGLAEIVAQIALKRITEEGKAKAKKTCGAGEDRAPRSTPARPTSRIRFSAIPRAVTLDGGTKIDLDNDTITLSDGTVIDIKTGVKKINITV